MYHFTFCSCFEVCKFWKDFKQQRCDNRENRYPGFPVMQSCCAQWQLSGVGVIAYCTGSKHLVCVGEIAAAGVCAEGMFVQRETTSICGLQFVRGGRHIQSRMIDTR